MRELGPEGFDETYFREMRTPETERLRKRYRLFGKAQEDPEPPPPAGTPMASRVERPAPR